MTPDLDDVREWARAYIRGVGWPVAPAWLAHNGEGSGCHCPEGAGCPRPGRHLASGAGVARTEEDVDKVWRDDLKNTGIAVLTGSDSGLLVLDVGHHGDLVRARFGIDGYVLTQSTPSGGRHWFFSIDETEGVYAARKMVELTAGVLVIGDAGFVLVGPRTGYEWLGGARVLVERGAGPVPESIRLALGGEKVLKPRGEINRDDPWRTAPGSSLAGAMPRSYTRLGDIRRIVDKHGHMMTWTPGLGYRVWAGSMGWQQDESADQTIRRYITELPEVHRTESADLRDRGKDSEAKKALKYSSVSANYAASRVLQDLQSEARIRVPDQSFWDSEGWVVGLPPEDGVGRLLNLRTGRVENDAVTRLVSRQLGVSYDDAKSYEHYLDRGDVFREYIHDLLVVHGPEWVRLLQRHAGASLFGRRGVEQDTDAIVVLRGATGSGKSTFAEHLLAVAGTYGKPLSPNVLFEGGNLEFALMGLPGIRVGVLSEPPANSRNKMDETRLKAVSGGDTQTGRKPFGRAELSFEPDVTLWLPSNHPLDTSDEAVWRRLRFFKFRTNFTGAKEDPSVRKRMKSDPAQLRAGLAWMLRGAQDYYREGWGDTSVLDLEKGAERSVVDDVARFLSECLTRTGSADGFTWGLLTSVMTSWQGLNPEADLDYRNKKQMSEIVQRIERAGLSFDARARTFSGGLMTNPYLAGLV